MKGRENKIVLALSLYRFLGLIFADFRKKLVIAKFETILYKN